MVIIFQSRKALNFLLENGFVYTFRARQRKTGRDWVTDRRGGWKLANVYIQLIGSMGVESLETFEECSGFNSVKEWIDEIKRLNKGKLPHVGFLYLVELEEADGVTLRHGGVTL